MRKSFHQAQNHPLIIVYFYQLIPVKQTASVSTKRSKRSCKRCHVLLFFCFTPDILHQKQISVELFRLLFDRNRVRRAGAAEKKQEGSNCHVLLQPRLKASQDQLLTPWNWTGMHTGTCEGDKPISVDSLQFYTCLQPDKHNVQHSKNLQSCDLRNHINPQSF